MMDVAKQRAEMLKKVSDIALREASAIEVMMTADPKAVEALWGDYDFLEKWLISKAYNNVNDLLIEVGKGYEERVS